MADKAVQRETVLSLRETIARIENRRLPGVVRATKAAKTSAAQSVVLLVVVSILTVVQFRWIERRVHY